jgi:hypothetical protein
MSIHDIEAAVHRLQQLGIDASELHQDYYKVPLENIDLAKAEKPQPTKSKVVSKHTAIIDSRQRDYSIYPRPSEYLIELADPHRSVEKIELIAAMMPKTEYNVSTENNLLIVNVGGNVLNGVIVGGTTSELRLAEGQYTIGSNIPGIDSYIADGSSNCNFGFIAELKRVLCTVSPDFNVFLATLPPGSGGTGNNASVLNRIVITNRTIPFIIDFRNQGYLSGSPFRVMGFNKTIYSSQVNSVVIYGSSDTGECSSQTLSNETRYTITINAINSIYDYNLKDDPNYVIMQLEFGNKSADRVESLDIATNQKFAIIIYDNNDPDNLETYNSSDLSEGVKFNYIRKPGNMKALKGSDFDKKIITFTPPITLDSFKISFYKYDNTFYDFHNREHMLTFEFDVADYDPTYRY